MQQHSTEKEIQKSISDYLKLKHYVIFKHNSTQFGVRDGKQFAFSNGERGISDLIGCSPTGRFIAVEVKKKGGKASPEQLEFLARVKANRGIAILAYSLDEVIDAVENAS